MSRHTPWGAAQHVINHCRGFSTVSTASHGGMMVSIGAAKKYLTEAARSRALVHGDYFCFEVDDMYPIVLFDAKEMRDKLCPEFLALNSMRDLEAHLIKDLSRWHPDYLIERGVTPDKGHYKIWLAHKEHDKAYNKKDPNLVVSFIRKNDSFKMGIMMLRTADAKVYYATSESYDSAVATDSTKAIYMTLDDLNIISKEDAIQH